MNREDHVAHPDWRDWQSVASPIVSCPLTQHRRMDRVNVRPCTIQSAYQSGQHDENSRITKRGSRHLRRVIWLMTIRVIQINDLFKNYYRKQIEDGLPFKKAVPPLLTSSSGSSLPY